MAGVCQCLPGWTPLWSCGGLSFLRMRKQKSERSLPRVSGTKAEPRWVISFPLLSLLSWFLPLLYQLSTVGVNERFWARNQNLGITLPWTSSEPWDYLNILGLGVTLRLHTECCHCCFRGRTGAWPARKEGFAKRRPPCRPPGKSAVADP